jgi:hypothetical protein
LLSFCKQNDQNEKTCPLINPHTAGNYTNHVFTNLNQSKDWLRLVKGLVKQVIQRDTITLEASWVTDKKAS